MACCYSVNGEIESFWRKCLVQVSAGPDLIEEYFMPKDLDSAVISKRIREERESQSMNQAKLAREAKITPAAISQIENGKRIPSVPILHRIAGVLNLSLDYLIGQSDQSQVEDMAQNSEFLAFYRKFQELSKEDREQILDQMEFLRQRKRG